MIGIGNGLRAAILALASMAPAGMALAQDMTTPEFWDDVDRNIREQQAEQMRLNQTLADEAMAQADGGDEGGDEGGYAPNSFVSFPPQAWADWANHARETHQQELDERFGKDPAYQALQRGTWTYHASGPRQSFKTCAATFWTRNGGVSFVHLGADQDFTLLGFFGAAIPSVRQPRVLRLQLIQSGEAQTVQALNVNMGSVKSMGMVLFNVHTPKTLIDSIEDRQDFEIRSNGKVIARGAWHSGLKARDQMASCLRSQGYLARK